MFPATRRPTRVIVDLKTIQKNIQVFQEHYPQKEIFAVVKANAYGHGMIEVAKAAAEAGVLGFCVALVDEAIVLRQAGFTQPILVLGISSIEDVPLLVQYGISATVSSLEWLKQAVLMLDHFSEPLKIHLALDTGMGRIGIRTVKDLAECQSFMKKHEKKLVLEGAFTHFATADDPNTKHLEAQLAAYHELLATLKERPRYLHCSNSAYAIWHDALETDVIRLGIGMYGIDPSNDTWAVPKTIRIEAALRWESALMYVKQLHAGDTVGYGATYTCQGDEWIATLPVGYADGFIRSYHAGDVLVQGHRCPIVGRICMDQCMIRLPHAMPVGTKVTLLGKDGNERITAEALSQRSDSIAYEVLCLISDRVPRVYLQ